MHMTSAGRSTAMKTAIWLLSFMLLLSSLTVWIRADEETSSASTETSVETTEKVVSDTLGNPSDELLDKDPAGVPVPDAASYLIYDSLSDTMLIGKDYDNPSEPAGITQIMTILLALERLQLSDEITITKEMYSTIPDDYVRIGFTEGEIVTVEECLYASILKSANDACMALAIHIGGSEENFVEMMNDRARELGCTNTHFTNPYGRSDADHVTTCRDLAIILKQALKQPDYVKVATTTSYTMNPTNKYNDKRILNNGNRFISTPSIAYEYYIGGKTAFSSSAGYTIIAGAEKEGRRLVGVLLGAGNAETRYDDMMKLLEYCFSRYTTTKVEETELSEIQQSTLSKIESVLTGTDLTIASTNIQLLEYYSIPLSLANTGYSNDIDLSGVVIDPKQDVQDIVLPIYRHFSENKSFRIGSMTIRIVNKNADIKPTEKTEDRSDINPVTILIIAVVTIVLITIVILAIVLFVKMTKKRKFQKNHKNPRIL